MGFNPNISKKLLHATDVSSGLATLTTAYASGWTSQTIPCGGLDKLKLLLTFDASIDATSVQLKSMVEDFTGSDFFTEFKTVLGTITLDEATLAVADLAAESYRISLEFDCRSFQQIKFAAKRSGGTRGTMQMEYIGK